MTVWTAVSKERHGNKCWHRAPDYFFAQKDAIAALNALEIPKAMMSTPLGFIQMDDDFIPVAIQGLVAGRNFFITPDGKWQTNHMPDIYRTYPFRLGKNEGQEDILCIDESGGRVSDTGDGENFFTEEGNPSDLVREVSRSLLQYAKDKKQTNEICSVLQKQELIQPWELELSDVKDSANIRGLYKIDEYKLNTLSADALVELRNCGALIIAYGQLFSMQLLPLLAKLANSYGQQLSKREHALSDLGISISADEGTLNFDNL